MKNILLICILTILSYSQSTFSDPQPTFDDPRKWVIQVRTADPEKINHLMGFIYNVLKEYPQETLKIAVVTYGPGVRILKKDYKDETIQKKIKSLIQYDVEFIACGNTMTTMKWKKKDFIEDINYVKAGIVELIEKVTDGYIEITPI